jgi:hypothetical protein
MKLGPQGKEEAEREQRGTNGFSPCHVEVLLAIRMVQES